MIQSDYFACENCGQNAKLLHALCPECLPKYAALDKCQRLTDREIVERIDSILFWPLSGGRD